MTLIIPAKSVAADNGTTVAKAVQTLLAQSDTYNLGNRGLRRFLTIAVNAVHDRSRAPGASDEQKEAWRALTQGNTQPAEILLYASYARHNPADARALAGLHLAAFRRLNSVYTGIDLLLRVRSHNPALAEAWLQSIRFALIAKNASTAADLTRQAIGILTTAEAKPVLARILAYGGVAQTRLGDYDTAEHWLNRALLIGKSLKQPEIQAMAHLYLAHLWLEKGDTKKTGQNLIYPDATPHLQAELNLAGGRLDVMSGDPLIGIRKMRKALDYFRLIGDVENAADASIHLAHAYLQTGRPHWVKEEVDEAQKLVIETWDGPAKIRLISLQGDLLQIEKNREEACMAWRHARLMSVKIHYRAFEQKLFEKIQKHQCLSLTGMTLLDEIVKQPDFDKLSGKKTAHQDMRYPDDYNPGPVEIFKKNRHFVYSLIHEPTNPYYWSLYGHFLLISLGNSDAAISAFETAFRLEKLGDYDSVLMYMKVDLLRLYSVQRRTKMAEKTYEEIALLYKKPPDDEYFFPYIMLIDADLIRAHQAMLEGDFETRRRHLQSAVEIAQAHDLSSEIKHYGSRLNQNEKILAIIKRRQRK